MENGTEKYIETIQYLEKLYEYCNGLLFEGKLKKPVINVVKFNLLYAFSFFNKKRDVEKNSGLACIAADCAFL